MVLELTLVSNVLSFNRHHLLNNYDALAGSHHLKSHGARIGIPLLEALQPA